MIHPQVSIGLPVCNGESSLASTLDSILTQDFDDYELIICDNASTDNTQQICRDYAAQDRRIRYFRNETNIGVNPNHNRVFHLSTGRYFTWLAHDVEYMPGMLSRCFLEMERAGSSVVLLYARCQVIRDGIPLPYNARHSIAKADPRPWVRLENIARRVCLVNQLYGLMRREALQKTRLNDSFASSDYILLAELAMLGEIRELPETLVRRAFDTERGTSAFCGDPKRLLHWIDPYASNRLSAHVPPRLRLAWEYFSSACQVEMRLSDRLPCMVVAPVLPYWPVLIQTAGSWCRRVRCRFSG